MPSSRRSRWHRPTRSRATTSRRRSDLPWRRHPTARRRGTFRDAKQRVVEDFERGFIGEALARHQGNISKAAEEMGMYRQQLQQKLTEYGIDADPYRQR